MSHVLLKNPGKCVLVSYCKVKVLQAVIKLQARQERVRSSVAAQCTCTLCPFAVHCPVQCSLVQCNAVHLPRAQHHPSLPHVSVFAQLPCPRVCTLPTGRLVHNNSAPAQFECISMPDLFCARSVQEQFREIFGAK